MEKEQEAVEKVKALQLKMEVREMKPICSVLLCT